MTEPTRQQRRGIDDRRSGLLRRRPDERRVGDRRTRRTGSHRWTGRTRRVGERRVAERRVLFDRRETRRRDSLSPLTAEEVDRVQRMFRTSGIARPCPACGAPFALGPPRRKGADTLRRVSCMGCGRATVVVNSLPARILVVEPKEPARASVRPMLLEAGHDVSEARDADQGLATYREAPSDVVIVDVTERSDFHGSRFISRLHDEFPSAAVVALTRRTSYVTGDRSSIASRLGAVVRRLPCSPSEMLESIEMARTIGP